MAASQLGTDLLLEPGSTISGYTVVTRELSNAVDMETKKNEAGAPKVRIVYSSLPTIALTLEPEATKDEAGIKADFPINAKSIITGLTAYTVESCDIRRSSGPAQVSVKLVLDGLS